MQGTIEFKLVTPEKHVMTQNFAMVVLPGSAGELGVLPEHVPLITTLQAGVIKLFQDRDHAKINLFVTDGYADINNNTCSVLASNYEIVEQMNYDAVQARLTRIREELAVARDEAEHEELKKVEHTIKTKLEMLRNLRK